MPKHSHLTLQDRGTICARINQGISFAQIAEELDRDPGTISKEIRLHRVSVEKGSYGRGFNPCIHRRDCKKTYVHVLLGKHADTGNVVRNQTAHAGDSAVLTSMYSAMRRS